MSYTRKPKVHKQCALEGCQVEFDTSNLKKLYCCKKHKEKSRYFVGGEYQKKGSNLITATCPRCRKPHEVNGNTHNKYTFCRFCSMIVNNFYEPTAHSVVAP